MGEMSSAVIGGVSVGKGFFRSKMDDMRNTVIPYQWKVFCDEVDVVPASHCVRNFRITAGDIEGSFYGAPYQDSDVAKWLETAAYCLEDHPDADLEKKADDAHVRAEEIRTLYIAGGFGSHLCVENAAAIGLIPSELTSRVRVIGNAALTGAVRLLLNAGEQETARAIAARSRHVNLSGNPVFNGYYMDEMFFPE